MADSKLSSLTAATSAGGSDLLYLVQGTDSKKITVANFLNGLGNVAFVGNVVYGGTAQSLTTPGSINTLTPITHLTADATGGGLTINRGTAGQVKFVTLVSTTGGAYALSGNIAGGATVTFDRVGDTAQLMYTSSNWYVVGGTANVTY